MIQSLNLFLKRGADPLATDLYDSSSFLPLVTCLLSLLGQTLSSQDDLQGAGGEPAHQAETLRPQRLQLQAALTGPQTTDLLFVPSVPGGPELFLKQGVFKTSVTKRYRWVFQRVLLEIGTKMCLLHRTACCTMFSEQSFIKSPFELVSLLTGQQVANTSMQLHHLHYLLPAL